MSSKKKFETMGGGYSAIGRVFERDAAIKEQEPSTSKPASVPLKDDQLEPNEPVVEVQPQPTPRQNTPKAPSNRIPASSKKATKKPPSQRREDLERSNEDPATTKKKRSIRARGRLPAIRVECLPDEFSEIEQLVFNLGRAAGYKVSNNIVGRALFRLALEAEDEIRKIVEKRPPRPRPANGDAEGLARHEDEWQQVLAEAMRSLRVRR